MTRSRKVSPRRVRWFAACLRLLGRHAWFVEDEVALVGALIPEEGVCVDVGAEFGLYTTVFSAAVGRKGRVLALEANPSLAYRLGRLQNLVGSDNVGVLPMAVMDQEDVDVVGLSIPYRRGVPVWGRSYVTDGANGQGPNTEFRDSRELMVPSLSLDRIVALFAPDRVDMIKADIEGAELLMLHGAGRLLSEVRPCWMIEIENRHLEKYGSSSSEVNNVFVDNGYSMYRSENGRWVRCDEVTEQRRNYLFLPNEDLSLNDGS